MLELKSIKKDYSAGDTVVHALKGVSLRFRESEFVSILGPSGCGKTTMLNIIGGLDQYSDGDLVINGRSTKDFRARDWDTYRNHSIGFVFQSYNLIPHQTVLQNVELALTLSGVSKSERRKRAAEALRAVGLGSQLKKRPREMSGGQMQRVAIARALVNDPDIILADEPTGALDTETSIQVMDILKEVAKDRLVVMVTHNPDLAEKYSTRIIRMLDGELQSDSAPLSDEETEALRKADAEKLAARKRREKKPSMSMTTSFGLSLKNLISKKGRTLLTSFAGSIGIIGIALIYSVSQGMTTYIDTVQEDTLSSYPLTIEATTVDIGTLLSTFMGVAEGGREHDLDAVYSHDMMFEMINAFNDLETTENDLKSFKSWLEEELAAPAPGDEVPLSEALTGVQYTYDIDLTVYTKDEDGEIVLSDTEKLMMQAFSENFSMDTSMMEMSSSMASASPMASMSGMSTTLWTEMLSGNDGSLINDVLLNQYDLIYGSWPNDYDEVVLVVNKQNELEDLTLYALGLRSQEEMKELFDAVQSGKDILSDRSSWSYEEICDMEFRVVLDADCYTLDETTGLYTDLRDTDAGLRYLYDKGLDLKVSGIIRPSETATASMLTGSIAYTKELTEYIVEKSHGSAAVNAQLGSKDTDIFTGLPFREITGQMSDAEKSDDFRRYAEGLSDEEKADVYVKVMSIPTDEILDGLVADAMKEMDRETMEQAMIDGMAMQMGMSAEDISAYTSAMSDEEMAGLFEQMIAESIKGEYAAGVAAQIGLLPPEQRAFAFDAMIVNTSDEQLAVWHDALMEFSDASFDGNLRKMGYVDLTDPSTVNLYASSFENKDFVEAAITSYNDGVDELQQISYTDYVGLMMSSVTTIINAITYVLIAFVAISLVVSSIMIGVITLISVQERTKEIGILRAIGASKKNVSSMFNAETIIIGFVSGLIGVTFTWLACVPINAIIQHLTNIENLEAYLPLPVAVILVAISVLLTVFAGVIPSRSAAKKDPVVALRSE
ncbi:MAG: ABC transporter ATP-binding protein/permease [Oscillospiraceae bacterium]|nr:ABC transporter ATP-binding protein/permease [Oscillospiraceae bacterium]